MSVVLRTVKAFPRGRTIEELHALLGTTFRHEERMALLGELEALAREGSIRRRHDGRWIPIGPPMTSQPGNPTTLTSSATSETSAIVAAPFLRTAIVSPPPIEESASDTHRIDPKALLRYWRSALRADPRGAITEAFDRHGTIWHLISGQGLLLPDEGQVVRLRIDLDALAPEFRAALVKHEANENALAIGWPLAFGRRSGAPAVWPVGLIAAEWAPCLGLIGNRHLGRRCSGEPGLVARGSAQHGMVREGS
ncbi:hypothetical protein EYE35_05580 [Cereibacter sphaeroides]|nr:hypothetical protein EYE35_05580 [Cereibacter sphaeroides]